MSKQSKAITRWHLERVSNHLNQTMLVLHLLKHNPDLWDDVQGWQEDEDGYLPDIFQWLVFPDF